MGQASSGICLMGSLRSRDLGAWGSKRRETGVAWEQWPHRAQLPLSAVPAWLAVDARGRGREPLKGIEPVPLNTPHGRFRVGAACSRSPGLDAAHVRGREEGPSPSLT